MNRRLGFFFLDQEEFLSTFKKHQSVFVQKSNKFRTCVCIMNHHSNQSLADPNAVIHVHEILTSSFTHFTPPRLTELINPLVLETTYPLWIQDIDLAVGLPDTAAEGLTRHCQHMSFRKLDDYLNEIEAIPASNL
ncbi:MAG: hypothetical protein H7061_00615 [Bdellovibrionaceae bacterium]|nr:hypothetical protein [Bdellovibrio sp.]